MNGPVKRKPIPRGWVEAAWKRQKGLCADCGCELQIFRAKEDNYAQGDHVVPITPRAGDQPGRHQPGNIAARCKRCNSGKHNKSPMQHSKHTGHTLREICGVMAESKRSGRTIKEIIGDK